MKIEKFISKKPFVIAGPCSAESEEQVLKIAHEIKNTTDVFRAGVWKPRTKPNSFEGRGKGALNWLKKSEINGGNNSGVINEHLGDVYQKLGNSKMAQTYWEKAFEIGDASDELKIKLNK